jgi:hypothetical protein
MSRAESDDGSPVGSSRLFDGIRSQQSNPGARKDAARSRSIGWSNSVNHTVASPLLAKVSPLGAERIQTRSGESQAAGSRRFLPMRLEAKSRAAEIVK